jgi:hypothetical protein
MKVYVLHIKILIHFGLKLNDFALQKTYFYEVRVSYY